MITLKHLKKVDFSILINWIDSKEKLTQFSKGRFSFPLTNEQLEPYISESNRNAFMVLNDEEIIGFGEIFLSKYIVVLDRILIGDSKLRKKGLGQKIVSELIRRSIENYGADEVRLNVDKTNVQAIKCFEKVGFKIKKQENLETSMIHMAVDEDNWIEIE